MNRRLLLQALTALVLFAIWTMVVRVGISDGSRDSAWIIRPFGDWPEEVHAVRGSSDIQLSIFATFASSDSSSETQGPIPDLAGRPVIGPAVDTLDSNNINGSRFTTGSRAGELSSISTFVAGPVDESPHDQFQLAIYEDSDGAPSHLLATTASGRLVPDAWNTLDIRAVLQPRASYWLMYNTNGSNGAVNNLAYTPVVGNPLDNAIRSHRTESLVPLADFLTGIGDQIPMVVAIVVISLIAARRRLRAGIALLLGFAVATFIVWIREAAVFDPYGGYPSGHATRAAYVAVAFCFLVTWRNAYLAAGLVVAVIGVAVVYAGGHYSEEVIGGLLLGWAIATAATAFAGDVTARPARPAVDVGPDQPTPDP